MVDPLPHWHLALAYAVTGRRLDGLSEPDRPDPVGLATELRQRVRTENLTLSAGAVADIPEELRSGLGPAQLAAALTNLHRTLGLGPATRVASQRPLDADERRLAADVPPHHVF